MNVFLDYASACMQYPNCISVYRRYERIYKTRGFLDAAGSANQYVGLFKHQRVGARLQRAKTNAFEVPANYSLVIHIKRYIHPETVSG